jgi:hypothetical protein
MKEALRVNIRCLLLIVLILSSSALQSLAYYHPDEGRWLSRDPITEEGFRSQIKRELPVRQRREFSKTLTLPQYVFVSNESIGHSDLLGLDRDLLFFGHMWIRLDTWDLCCKKTGQVDLHFHPNWGSGSDWDVWPIEDTPYSHYVQIHIRSTCEEDRQLLELWQSFQNSPDSPRWDPLFNCWVPSIQFADWGVASFPPPNATYSPPDSLPGWPGNGQNNSPVIAWWPP